MYTPYYSTGWQTGETGNTPITPEALNNMEQGIKAAHPTSKVITLSPSVWLNNKQTILVSEVAADSNVIVTPNPVSHEGYCNAGVRCTGQYDGSLVFECTSAPAETLAVNVLILVG